MATIRRRTHNTHTPPAGRYPGRPGAGLPAGGGRSYLKVLRQQQLAGAQEAEDVAEDVAVTVDEVVLLQAVQHDGLGAVEQAADPART